MPDGNGDFWNPELLSTSDPLNEEIWLESRNPKLNPVMNVMNNNVGAQQAMVGENILPWVPDIVGKGPVASVRRSFAQERPD
ncbi:MAG TPA: hypothetical protein PK022_03645, partial [Syntrophales bacterium]|nr:hypothetical protein [Syntrophales bacterium]